MSSISSEVEFRLPGRLELSERGEKKPPDDLYDSTELVNYYLDEVECELRWAGDPDEDDREAWGRGRPVVIKLRAYHVENEATARAFHAHFVVAMTRLEARALRDALGFFLAIEDAAT